MPSALLIPQMLRYKMILRVLLLFSFICCVCETFKVYVTQSYEAEENEDITLEFSFEAKDNTFIEIFCEELNDPWAEPVFQLHGSEEVPQSQDEQFADQVQCDEDVFSEMSTDQGAEPVFQLHESEEVPQSEDEQFADEDPCDEDDEMLTDQRAKVLFHLCGSEEVPQSQDEQFAGRVQFDKAALQEGRVRLHVSKLRIEDLGLYQLEVFTSSGVLKKTFFLRVTARDQPESEKPNTASWGRTALYWSLGVTAATAVLFVVDYFQNHKSAELRSADSNSHPKNQGRSVRKRKIYQVVVFGIRGEKVIIDLCNTEEQMNSMTVRQLKEKIAQKLCDTAGLDNLRLIFTDKALEEDTDLLSEYGIQHMSVIHIVLKVPGGLTA